MMKKYIFRPEQKLKRSRWDPDDTGDYPSNDKGREEAETQTQDILTKLSELQEILYASSKRAFLIVFQAMDTGGKDSTIKHVMTGVNPQGCKVASFKVPTPQELAHDFLWRVHRE